MMRIALFPQPTVDRLRVDRDVRDDDVPIAMTRIDLKNTDGSFLRDSYDVGERGGARLGGETQRGDGTRETVAREKRRWDGVSGETIGEGRGGTAVGETGEGGGERGE